MFSQPQQKKQKQNKKIKNKKKNSYQITVDLNLKFFSTTSHC